MENLVTLWDLSLASIPTIHLLPLYQHMLANRPNGYPIQVKDIAADWVARYEEEPGYPPTGYSWKRDQFGNFVKSEFNQDTQTFPLGGRTPAEEIALLKAEREKYEEKQMRLGNPVHKKQLQLTSDTDTVDTTNMNW